jgi:hypothetical protein
VEETKQAKPRRRGSANASTIGLGACRPIGKRFGSGINGIASARSEIVGVVNDAKYRSLREPIQPMFYELGVSSDSFVLNVRTSVKPDANLELVQKKRWPPSIRSCRFAKSMS